MIKPVELNQYKIFDEYLLLMSEVDGLSTHLHTYMKGLYIPSESWQETTLRLAVFNAPKKHAIICCPEVGVAERHPVNTWAYMGFRRLLRVLTFDKRYPHYPFHACCVATKDGRAILLAGSPSAGKTSLTGALLQRGFRFGGDDQAYLYEDGTVIAFPVGSSVSDNTFSLIPELRSLQIPECCFNGYEGPEWTVNYGDAFPSIPAYTRLMVSHLFFIMPNFGKENSVIECSLDTAIWHFLNFRHVDKRLIPDLSDSANEVYDRSFRLMQRLKRAARFYEVSNGDLHKTADLIAQTVGM